MYAAISFSLDFSPMHSTLYHTTVFEDGGSPLLIP